MSGKFALIIANTEYDDPGLARLTAPGRDAEDLSRILKDKEICSFDEVKLFLNQPEYVLRGAIDEFFDQKKPDDLLLLYFSGHGVRDELGSLYLAVKNTIRSRLRSTAIKSDFIRESMDHSRSKRQVLIMDCCNSGAFTQGTKAATGVSIGTASAFEAGYGRIILTASDATQFAWEGDKVIGETDNSLFTHFLVEGLGGGADINGDGRITVDELYDYSYEKVKLATPKQTPLKFSNNQQGEIVLRQNIPIEDIRPASLPPALLDTIENPFPDIRLGAVQQLIKLSNGKNLGLARSAREVLERIAKEDDSRTVSRAASNALEAIHNAEHLHIQNNETRTEVGQSAGETKVWEEHKAKEQLKQGAAAFAKEKSPVHSNTIESRFKEQKAEKNRENVNPLSQMASEFQKGLISFQSALPARITPKYWVAGLGALFIAFVLFLPQLAYSSSKSIEQIEGTGPPGESIRIKNNIDYAARSVLLNGFLLDIEAQTDNLQHQLCQVVVYFEHSGDLVTTSKSLTTFLSPYISDGSYVSAFANFAPEYQQTKTTIKLFIPYAAFANSDLSDDSVIRFFADLYTVDDRTLLARSSPLQFKYSK